MNKNSLLVVWIGMLLLVTVIPSWAQPGTGDDSYPYTFAYTPIYQFDADLDNGGSFDVNRHYLNLDFKRQTNGKVRFGLGLTYEFEEWNFDDVSNIAQASTWDIIHRPGVSLPISYSFSNQWTLGVSPSLEFSGESGVEIDDGLVYGGSVMMTRPYGEDLFLGFGFGISNDLEESSFFPILIFNWQINEQWRLSNPSQVGPAGPAGLELVYNLDENWELGGGVAYRSYRFRLKEDNSVSDGVAENEFILAFLRVQRQLGGTLKLDLTAGGLFGGELSIENSNGNDIASEDYDPAPMVALTFKGSF